MNRGFLQKALVVLLLSLQPDSGRDLETQGQSAGVVWYLLEDKRLKDYFLFFFKDKKLTNP